ncbi:LLM class flavin-dependent oxidoreductase [Streptomyces sp. NPDC087300]|uniref:LLM class flavin-dependent oxidoreductase n=1 Tax=Streptomyces sp. NPDC087300 TaxID=3365780 RepID=UPI003800C0BE
MSVTLGVCLPTFERGDGGMREIPALARHAEQVGLDMVWAGDHLCAHIPFLESVVALSAAAAVTERVRIGFGVMLLALRQQAWAAKQLSSLQYLSGNRVVLGVGTGIHPQDWPVGGVPFAGRGRRTEVMLRALPDLFAGRPTPLLTVPGGPVLTLEPAVPAPPVWVGGMSDRVLRRALEHGLSERQALRLVVSGPPEKLAERLDHYLRAGARTFVVNLSGDNLRRQYELLARTRELLPG